MAELIRAVATACTAGDTASLEPLLTREVIAIVDRGSREGAGARGRTDVAALLIDLTRDRVVDCTPVNGQPGLVLRDGAHVTGVLSFSSGPRRVRAVFVTLNPDKLANWL